MRRTLGVGVVLLLAALLSPSTVFGQQSSGERAKSRLGQNYPNPFNPTTTIPFELFEEDFVNGKPAVVTIRIYDYLMRPVAIPLAKGHASGAAAVENLEYTAPGSYQAYWEGTDRFGKKVASGIYLLEVVVNGRREAPKKMVVAK
jgi:hypothetical protein